MSKTININLKVYFLTKIKEKHETSKSVEKTRWKRDVVVKTKLKDVQACYPGPRKTA